MPSMNCAGSPGSTSRTRKMTTLAAIRLSDQRGEAAEEVGGHRRAAQASRRHPATPGRSPPRRVEAAADHASPDRLRLRWEVVKLASGAGLTRAHATHSAHFTSVRSFAWIGAFSHRPLHVLASRRRSWGARTGSRRPQSSARLFWRLLAAARCAWPRRWWVEVGDDLVEGRVVVVEVVVLARIDIDVVRLDVADDGQVVVLVG